MEKNVQNEFGIWSDSSSIFAILPFLLQTPNQQHVWEQQDQLEAVSGGQHVELAGAYSVGARGVGSAGLRDAAEQQVADPGCYQRQLAFR